MAAAASNLSRFQGSLVGAVVGDCIGAVFEGGWFQSVELDRIYKLSSTIEKGIKSLSSFLEF